MPKSFVVGPLYSGNVLVSKKIWITSYRDFVETFCLTSPKIIVGEPFCVSELFWYQNVLDNRVITFLSILFVSQYQKICVQPSNDSKKLGHPKCLCTKEEVNDFPWINFGLTGPKNIVGNASLFQSISDIRKNYSKGWRGVLRFSVGYFLSHFPEKLRTGHFSV